MRANRGKLSDQSGLSLVEMLLSVILLFILLTGVLFMFTTGLSNAKKIQARSILNVDAGNTMEKMRRQIRCAKSFAVPTTNSPIDFTGDVRGDGVDREIIFYRDANNNTLNLTEKVGASTTTQVIARGVTALSFTYYDAGGTALTVDSANRTSIARVGISFTMQRSGGDSVVSTTKNGTVTIRCYLSYAGDDWRAML